ncbi:chromogranin-A-like isoform X1 [Crotalus tigris]|uniref:chromogranin-A-like isoform X1 n=1 Tax=Crotalus tigris TaxID=88082 RepID=UPI00192F3411|nr:chromogranin-A-like isoform X1 [Crotalus tigris]
MASGMTRAAFFAAFLLVAPVISLPVTNPTTEDDTKVMACIAEVISNTVAKPKPLSISQECLETLQGDERIRSILRHQNLLRELQEIAVQGASERTEQQKKNSGFEDELSEVLESQGNGNTERDASEGTHNEKPTASLAELETEKSFQNKQNVLKEERNSLEEKEPRIRGVDPEDEKENITGFEGNEVDEMEGLPWSDAIDNRISDIRQDDVLKLTHQEVEKVAETEESEDENEHVFKESQEERKEEEDGKVREQVEKEEEDKEEKDEVKDEEQEEKERNASEEEHPTNSDNVDDQREDDNQDDGKNFSEEKDKYHNVKSREHRFLDGTRQDDDSSHDSDSKSEEMEKTSFQDVEDAKRWNKMDELAKQLTTTKRAEENESDEDPDRSMKMAFKSHNTVDFHKSPEDEARRLQKHHSKEDSEQGFPLLPIPEEKKDEEGSANRRTEDQELESLAAIEAELEKVARKLHALRRG